MAQSVGTYSKQEIKIFDQFIIKHVEVKTLLNYSVGESYTLDLAPKRLRFKKMIQISSLVKHLQKRLGVFLIFDRIRGPMVNSNVFAI